MPKGHRGSGGYIGYSSIGSGIVRVKSFIELRGLSASLPATSGLDVLNQGLPTGNYWIKPTGYSGSAEYLWVDNTNQGGGWVLIGKGRQSSSDSGGWFGTDNAITTDGLTSTNALSAGVSKVSASFVNYLMNGTASGWSSGNANNYLVANRINNATDGYSGLSGSSKIKVTNTTTFSWVNQFGGTTSDNQTNITGSGLWYGYSGTWLSGTNWWSTNSGVINDALDRGYTSNNNEQRWFQWHWSGHGSYHGWSSGNGITTGFQNGSEYHAIQFMHLWAR
jgi:hypothetical protein